MARLSKTAEAAREVIGETFADLLELTHDSIYVRDLTGAIRYWNRAAEELYGWTREQAMGRQAHDLINTIFPVSLAETQAEVIRADRWQGELVHTRRDGSRVIVSSRWSLRRDENGAPLEILVSNNDITERKRTESLLAGEKRILEMVARENSLGEILDSLCRLAEAQAPGAFASVLLLDGDRLRYGAAPSLPKAYTDAIDGTMIGPVSASCGTAAYHGRQIIVDDIATDPLWVEYRGLALSQSLRACWSTPVFSSERNVIATFAMYFRERRTPSARDQEIIAQITDLTGVAIGRKLTQDRLQRSESYLAEAQRLSHSGSWAVSGVGKQIYSSEENTRIWGFDPRDGVPELNAFVERMHPEDRERAFTESGKAISEGRDHSVEYRVIHPDGSVRHLHEICHPVLGPGGEVVEIIGTNLDVTDRKHAEEERERLRQLEGTLARINRVTTMGELAASLAHEIKQPLAAAVLHASTCLRWLKREVPDFAEAAQASAQMQREAMRAAQIVDRVGSLYRRDTPLRKSIDISETVREMTRMLQDQAVRQGVTIRTELADQLPCVTADRVQVQQVLMNLMVNGLEAMKDTPGELSITAGCTGDEHLLMAVSDDGPGMDLAQMEKVFDVFFTTKPQGTGMGLSISRTIIEAHGGKLWASRNAGRGMTFSFTLPSDGPAR